jgi:hypothetical protein
MAIPTSTSTRIKANALLLSIGGVDYWADFSSVVLQSEDASADVNTFYDSASGGRRDFYFTVAGVQSTESTSFWRAMWTGAGTEVAFIYAPHGNAAETADKPLFKGTVRLPAKGALQLGGESSADGTFAFDGVRMDVVGDVTLDATP